MVTCDQITEDTKIVLRTYDLDNDGYLSKDESVTVVRDYFNGVPGITREIAVGAASAYELQCNIDKSMTCSQITEAQKVVLRTYDVNNDGYLSKDESVTVVRDYFNGVPGITREIGVAAVTAYNLQCDIGKSIVICLGIPGPVTNLVCSKSGSTINVSWIAPSGGSSTYDRFRVHYYIGGTVAKEQFVTGTSDSYTSSAIDSIRVSAMCKTNVSSSVTSVCIGDVINGPCGRPICYACSGTICYQNNADGLYTDSKCTGGPCEVGGGGGGCIPNYVCRSPLNGYEYDANSCPGSVDRLADRCKPIVDGGNGGSCGTGQVNIFGSCYKTNNVLLIGGAVLLVVMMK